MTAETPGETPTETPGKTLFEDDAPEAHAAPERGDGAEEDVAGDSGTQGEARFDSVKGGIDQAAGVINNNQTYSDEQNNFLLGLDERASRSLLGRPTRLTVAQLDVFDAEQLHAKTETILTDPLELERLSGFFGSRRVLLLSGACSLGKGALALKLAARMCRELGMGRARRNRSPLTRHLAVDLHGLIDKSQELHDTVIILDGVFRQENEDLTRFAGSTDTLALGALEDRLAKARSLLILTFDQHPPLHPALEERVEEAMGPTAEQLREYLFEHARRRVASEGEEHLDALGDLLERHGDAMLSALASVPRIEAFVRDHLLALLENPELPVVAALSQVGRLDRWLLEEQARDLQALSYALAMALSHSGPAGTPVRWFQFERLRSSVLEHLRRQLGRSDESLDPSELCREPELLRRLQIEVVAGDDGGGDLVRFQDSERADKLWACLLGGGRSLAAHMVPLLIKLADSDEHFLRQLAGQALGRLGRLDPFGIFGRLFQRWSRNPPSRDILGALCLGAILSGDLHLERLCRRQIRAGLADPDFARVEAAAIALGDIGQLDMAFTLRELQRVVEQRLVPCLEKLHDWERGRRRGETHLHEQTRQDVRLRGLRSAVANLNDRRLEAELANEMPNVFRPQRESRILGSCQYSLVGLCFEHGTQLVLEQLMGWMPAGKEAKLGPMLALFFLRNGGIFPILERYPLQLESGAGEDEETWSRILVSAVHGEGGLGGLVDFLFGLYLGTCEFPRAFGRVLMDPWLGLVELWTHQAARGYLHRETVIELWCRMLKLPDRELRFRLQGLMDHPDLAGASPALGRLVEEIQQRQAGRLALDR